MKLPNDQKTFATCKGLVFDVSIARVSSKYLFVNTMTWWSLFVLRKSRAKMSVATNSNGPNGWNTCSKRFRL